MKNVWLILIWLLVAASESLIYSAALLIIASEHGACDGRESDLS